MAPLHNLSRIDLAHAVCAPHNIYAKEHLKKEEEKKKEKKKKKAISSVSSIHSDIHQGRTEGKEGRGKAGGEQSVPRTKSTDMRVERFCLEQWDQVVGGCCS